jgi:hypothetical protein
MIVYLLKRSFETPLKQMRSNWYHVTIARWIAKGP